MINYKIDNFKEEIKDILIENRLVVIKSSAGYSECFDLNNNDIRYIKDYLYENQ